MSYAIKRVSEEFLKLINERSSKLPKLPHEVVNGLRIAGLDVELDEKELEKLYKTLSPIIREINRRVKIGEMGIKEVWINLLSNPEYESLANYVIKFKTGFFWRDKS